MDRASYAFAALSEQQYEAILTAGSMGAVSPMLGHANYDAFLAACQGINCDPRVLLAGLQLEDHFGGDPNGAAAASVNNLSGIKWAGQSDATDSGIPADTGGTYAKFVTPADFFNEYAQTLVNEFIGPAFNSGDLARAWGIYIGGPDSPNVAGGQARVDQWQFFLATYPPSGPVAVPPRAVGVYGEDLIARFETQIGHPTSGAYDAMNGDHPWAYWCRAGVESTGRNCGLTVVAHASGYEAQQAAASQGLLVTDVPPEHGAVVQLDTRFYSPDGHTGLWNADKGQLLCTLTDGTGVGYRAWGPGTIGYAGWYRLPGVVAPKRSADVSVNLVIPGNPYNAGVSDPMLMIGVGGANRRLWESTPYALQMLGWPMRNEQQALVYEPDGTHKQRTVQYYERAVTIYAQENSVPWDITVALATQRVFPLGG